MNPRDVENDIQDAEASLRRAYERLREEKDGLLHHLINVLEDDHVRSLRTALRARYLLDDNDRHNVKAGLRLIEGGER